MGTDVEREISGPSIWQNKKGISGRCRIGTRHAGPKEENTLWRGVSRSELDGFAVRRLRVEHPSRRWIVAHESTVDERTTIRTDLIGTRRAVRRQVALIRVGSGCDAERQEPSAQGGAKRSVYRAVHKPSQRYLESRTPRRFGCCIRAARCPSPLTKQSSENVGVTVVIAVLEPLRSRRHARRPP